MVTIDRARLGAALTRELARFADEHPRSRALFERAKAHLHDGVPMSWMTRWAGAFPLFVDRAKGARFTDVDGKAYVDFCLGDTGAMTGHAPDAALAAIKAQLDRGITFMLPTEDALAVSDELARRFGLPAWQVAMTATDANRHVIRIARHVTGRPGSWSSTGATTAPSTRPSRRWGRTAASGRAPETSARRSIRPSPPGWWSSTTWRRSRASSATATWPACWPSRP